MQKLLFIIWHIKRVHGKNIRLLDACGDHQLHVLAVVVRYDLGRDVAAEVHPALVIDPGSAQGYGNHRLDRLGVDVWNGVLRHVSIDVRVSELDVLVRLGVDYRWGGGSRRDVWVVKMHFFPEKKSSKS